jgi:hypothetical protein
VAGEPIKDRIVSLSDPDARPIRKGKLGKPNEFGYVSQIAEITEHTQRGARGVIVPASTRLGNPGEDTLLPDTIGELARLGIRPREIALDGGFNPGPTHQALADHDLNPERVSSPAANSPAAGARSGECSATEPAPKDASVTSNAATAWTDPGSKATTAARSGRDGRSWPTTLTPSPSGSDETLPASSI